MFLRKIVFDTSFGEECSSLTLNFKKLTVFVGRNTNAFHLIMSLLNDSIPKWQSSIIYEDDLGNETTVCNEFYANRFIPSNDSTNQKFFIEDLRESYLDPVEKVEYVSKLISSKHQGVIATHCPIILNHLPDDVAKESMFYIFDFSSGDVTRFHVERFFADEINLEKLSVMGPGEVFNDTDLLAYEKRRQDALNNRSQGRRWEATIQRLKEKGLWKPEPYNLVPAAAQRFEPRPTSAQGEFLDD